MTEREAMFYPELAKDDSLALHTDLYEINMMYTYFKKGIADRNAVFESFYRREPFGNGYAVYAGLEHIINYLKNLKFTESDLQYLKENEGYDDDFIDYLRNLKLKLTIRSMKEGELVFANEPILQVEGPLAQCQLVETAILNIINFQTLLATKAARIKLAVKDDGLMEFGSRRAQETDAAIWGARAAYIGGFDSTLAFPPQWLQLPRLNAFRFHAYYDQFALPIEPIFPPAFSLHRPQPQIPCLVHLPLLLLSRHSKPANWFGQQFLSLLAS